MNVLSFTEERKAELKKSTGAALARILSTPAFSDIPRTLHPVSILTSINSRGFRPIHYAAASNDVQLLRALFDLFACFPDHRQMFLDSRDREGNTALHWAVMKGNLDAFVGLMEFGVAVNLANYVGHTPLHLAISLSENDYEIKSKKQSNANIAADNNNATSSTNNSTATSNDATPTDPGKSNDYGGGKDHGNDDHPVDSPPPDTKDDDAIASASHISEQLCSRIVSLLLHHGANPNIGDPTGLTPIHLASSLGKPLLITTLVEEGGANVNVVDEEGETPLFYAVRGQHEDSIKVLVQHGVNLGTRNGDGETAMEICRACGDIGTEKLLEEQGRLQEEQRQQQQQQQDVPCASRPRSLSMELSESCHLSSSSGGLWFGQEVRASF